MMLISVIRFWANGWIEKLYLEPTYFFSYRYFEWVKPLGDWTYVLFALVAITSIMILLGWKYRFAMIVFFFSFTFIELMDKTTYLNHYYFISLLSFLLIWLPLSAGFSLDARKKGDQQVPAWAVWALKLFVGVVYFYAGLAKLNSDWLLSAQPLAIWLPAKYDVPLLGNILHQSWVHYAFAWAGAAYDLFIPFLLLWKPSRWLAFVAVVVFHILTRVLFPIGMFPFIMIVSALIFFDASFHARIIAFLRKMLGRIHQAISLPDYQSTRPTNYHTKAARAQVQGKVFKQGIVGLILLIHLLLPWRYALYPGELFWTESGYRFSWRVMLMEKAGYITYRLIDPESGKKTVVNPEVYLTSFQQKQLATQPDFILEFAHFLAREHQEVGRPLPTVFAESYVALNGRGSRVYVDPEVDLTTIDYHTPRIKWLMPFQEEIYGL